MTGISPPIEILKDNTAYSFLTVRRARIHDLVPDQRCAIAQEPPILPTFIVDAHDLSSDLTRSGVVSRAPLFEGTRSQIVRERDKMGGTSTLSSKSRYHGLQSG